MSKLYVVPTPIGNLEDITMRAIRILKEVDLVYAEDTRTSSRLLEHYEVSTPLISFHKYNEHQRLEKALQHFESGKTAALISDAGTPGISDPGFLLIRECLRKGIAVESLPGPTAFIPALLNSGIPTDRFFFEGFLPVKKGRATRIKFLSEIPHTLVFYESPHRLLKTLEQLAAAFGPDRKGCVSREISKMYEENVRNTLGGLIETFRERKIRGEIVIVVEGKQ